ncbi:nucleoprotein [hymenopteran chu-related virus 126]|uniref:Nucleoprotein n=1 Tax=hymenopteran chu-related virus 126 TaxID=2847798 RepID=A0A7U3NUW0_9VIRU|nr:nucleoprotein [hymenopteran chu-related virus 126]QPB73969.1 nucleoprotein [hymenopteran chu-related virus 126]
MALGMRIAQGRRHGVPSLISNLANLLHSGSESAVPLLPVAVYDALKEAARGDEVAFCTWLSRASIADAIAKVWAVREGVTDEAKIMARAYGELVALWVVSDKSTLLDVKEARQKIISDFAAHSPSVNDIRSLIAEITHQVARAGNGMAPREDVKSYIPGNPLDGERMQRVIFYKYRGHLLPSAIFRTSEARDIWTALSQLDKMYVPVENIDFSLVDDFSSKWATCGEDTVIGFYEGRTQHNPAPARSMIAGAVFTMLTCMTKESNLTPGWVSRRRTQFQALIPDIALEDYITQDIIKHFSQMYTKEHVDWNVIYNILVVSWSHLQASGSTSLCWIIEQSANSNITGAANVAEVVSKLTYFDAEHVIQRGIPLANMTALIKLLIAVYRSPFSSINKPPVQLREYADIAALAIIIRKEFFGDGVFAQYRGQAMAMCVNAEVNLKVLAAGVFAMSQDAFGSEASTADFFRKLMESKGHVVKLVNDQAFVIPNKEYKGLTDTSRGEGVSESDTARSRQEEQREEDRAAQLAARADWPRSVKNLPRSTKVFNTEEMIRELETTLTPRALAFRRIMSWAHAHQLQLPLVPIGLSATNVPSAEKQVPEEIAADAKLWGVTIPLDWTQPIPAYTPNTLEQAAKEESYSRGPRASVNTLPQASGGPSYFPPPDTPRPDQPGKIRTPVRFQTLTGDRPVSLQSMESK